MRKGYLFEQWVVKQFSSQGYTLLEWRSDKAVNGIYPLSSKKPDLVFDFDYGDSKRFYAIECKWRKDLSSGFNLISKGKTNEYNEFSIKMQTPVFVAIGIGGSPGSPERTYLIPLRAFLESPTISDLTLSKYEWSDTFKLETLTIS